MGYCQEENEKQETKKCRWAEGHCQRNLGFHTTSAVPQTDHLHATPCWGRLKQKEVNEHTFQKANNSLNILIFFIGLMKYSNCWESDLLGFC